MSIESLLTQPLDFGGLFFGLDKLDFTQPELIDERTYKAMMLLNLANQLEPDTQKGDGLLEQYVHECWVSFKRQFLHRDDAVEGVSRALRLSQLGKPAVLQALKLPQVKNELMSKGLWKDEGIDLTLRHIFHKGDVFEAWAIFMLKLNGCCVEREQETINYMGVDGHIDLVANGRLIEVKTMSNAYFSQFVKYQSDARGYTTQMALYQHCTGLQGTWLCVNKETNQVALIEPKQTQMEYCLSRASTIIPRFAQVSSFEDLLVKVFRAPPPEEEGRVHKTGRFKLPQSMAYSPMKGLFYKMTSEKNRYGKMTEYFVDYVYPEDYKTMSGVPKES